MKLEAIKNKKSTPIHRKSFNPVSLYLIDGIQSHEWLRIMFDNYGQDDVNDYLEDNYWSKER